MRDPAAEARIRELTYLTAEHFRIIRDPAADPWDRYSAAGQVGDIWSSGFDPGSSGARFRLHAAIDIRAMEEGVPAARVRADARSVAVFGVAAAASSSAIAADLMRAARAEYLIDFAVSLYGGSVPLEPMRRAAFTEGGIDIPAPDLIPPIPPIEASTTWADIRPVLTARQIEMVAAHYETLDSARASELIGVTHENGRRVRKDAEDRLLRAGFTDPRSDLHGGRYLWSEGTTVPSTQT